VSSHSVFTRLARRLGHPYSVWVVIRAITLWLASLKLLFWSQSHPLSWLWVSLAGLWVGLLAVYPLYRARGRDSQPDDPFDPYWCRPARPSLWQRRWLWMERRRLLPVLEVGTSSLLLLVSGGLNSPFHEFAQTSLVAPALQYGLRGAGWGTLYFLLLYTLLLQPVRPLDPLHWFLLFSPIQTSLLAALLGLLLAQMRQRNLMAEEASRNQERHRLIQELHDGSAQTQYALNLKLENLAERAQQGGVIDARAWDRLIYLSRKVLLETRQAMVDPDLISNRLASLEELFQPLTRDFQSVSGIAVHLRLEASPRLTPSQRIHLFRFTQEALANIFKYSGASQAWVVFEQQGKSFRLEVRDDGKGYDSESVQPGRGWGNLQRRAEDLGGRLLRWSQPGQGSWCALEWEDDYRTYRR
jgi:signal transduction histidine kinase